LKADLATANSKVNSLNSQVSGLNAQITSLNAQIAALTADKKACEEKLAKTSSNISVSEDCTPYKNKVKELELKTADLELKNKTLEAQNSTLTSKNAELEAAVKTNESTLSQLKATISKQAADIENLKAASSKCESDKTAISVQLEAAKKKIAELEMAAGSSNNSELTAQVNTLNSQVSALKEQLQSKESQLQTANNKIASMESKIALLEKQIAECNSIVNAAKTDLDECLKAKSILEGDESRLRKQIIQMDEDMGKLSEIIKSNSAEITKLKAENAALTLKLKECQTKLNPTPEAP
jgi:chromosome segregation ATPase